MSMCEVVKEEKQDAHGVDDKASGKCIESYRRRDNDISFTTSTVSSLAREGDCKSLPTT